MNSENKKIYKEIKQYNNMIGARACAWCGKPISTEGHYRKYCDAKCRRKAEAKRRKRYMNMPKAIESRAYSSAKQNYRNFTTEKLWMKLFRLMGGFRACEELLKERGEDIEWELK